MIQPYVVTPATPTPGYVATMATLSDGRVIEIWESVDRHTISGQFYSPDGVAEGAAFTLISGNDYFSNPAVAATGSGGFIVSYGASTADNSTYYAAAEVFDRSGSSAGSAFTEGTGFFGGVSFAVNQVTGQSALVAGSASSNLLVFGNINGTVGSTTSVHPVPSQLGGLQGAPFSASVVALAGGNFAVAFETTDRTPDLQHISTEEWVDLYHPDGSFVTSVILHLGADRMSSGSPRIAALQDGGFAVTYTVSTNVEINVFNADGSPHLAQSIVLNNAAGPQIAGLTNGLFAVEWQDTYSPAGVYQQVYNPDGTPYGLPYTVYAGFSQNAASGRVYALPNGEFTDIFVGDTTAGDRLQITYGTQPPALPLAVPQLAGSIDFGIVHVHDAAPGVTDAVTTSLAVTNANADPTSAKLAGGPGAISGAGFTASGDLGSGLASGQTSSLTYTLSTAQAGVFTGSAALALASRDPNFPDTPLPAGPVTLSGTVNNYAVVQIIPASGNWTSYVTPTGFPHTHTLDLGTFLIGAAAPGTHLVVSNAASGPADLLGGGFTVADSTGFANSGLGDVSGLIAGTIDSAPVITPQTAQGGTFVEEVTFHGTGSNASGFSQSLADETITITALVAYSLTTAADTIAAGNSDDLIITTADALTAGDRIDGSGGVNTLQLTGGGTFRIGGQRQFANIQIVTAQEGRPSYVPASGPPTVSTFQTVKLTSGIDITLNVLPAAPDPSNPLLPGIIVRGADDSSLINLASGNDIVYLGSSRETVIAHGGIDTFHVTAATIGATMDGGSGGARLVVTGGGTMVMGSNISNIASVVLAAGGAPYVFTANGIADLSISGSTSSDTITVGAPSQIVSAGSGDDRILTSAANAGARIDGGTGANTLEITTGGTVTLNPMTRNVTVVLDAATNLTLNGMQFLTAIGSGGQDVIRAGGNDQVLSGRAGSDTLDGRGFAVTFRDISAALSGDTIIGLLGSHGIDATDLDASTTHASWLQGAGQGLLSLTDAHGHGAAITLVGTFAANHFHTHPDGVAGTTITYI